MSEKRKTYNNRFTRGFASACGGFLLWGGWAFFANWEYGLAAGAKAMATQGSLTFVATFFITMSVEALVLLSTRPWIQYVTAMLGTYTIIIPVSVGSHWAMGTPEILKTVAPVFGVGFVFLTSYIFGLFKIQASEANRQLDHPALDPSPVIPSDLSFGYLSAELKSPVKIPILDGEFICESLD